MPGHSAQPKIRLVGWSDRAPAPPVIEAGSGHRKGARHVSEIYYRNRRSRLRYRQELVHVVGQDRHGAILLRQRMIAWPDRDKAPLSIACIYR
jgi:hypothetical protein